jgi:hypothetical protein
MDTTPTDSYLVNQWKLEVFLSTELESPLTRSRRPAALLWPRPSNAWRDEHEWFLAEVKKGLAQAGQGETWES